VTTANNTSTVALTVLPATTPPIACDYYAAPNGAGDGLSSSSPFRVSDFWTVARPGTILCLLDGTYQGAEAMINPVAGLSGTSGNPITIRALNDGAVTIDGQFARRPVSLNRNSWWLFQGFNAKNGTLAVLYVNSGSDNNTFRRIVAWDTKIDQNSALVTAHGSINNVFEDVAGFGVARKMFSGSQGGHAIVCRRCWFRWEGNTWGSPLGVTIAYNNREAILENVLVNWSGESMPHSHTPANGGAPQTDYNPQAPVGLIAIDRIDCGYDVVAPCTPKEANASVRGSIAYVKSTDRLPTSVGGGTPGRSIVPFVLWGASKVTVSDVIAVISPSNPRFNNHLGIALVRRPQNCVGVGAACEDPVVENKATRLTSIRGTHTWGTNIGDSFGTNGVSGKANETDWAVTNVSTGTSLAVVQSPWQNVSTNGARLCYRWGTTTKLWPWPMNDRIESATAVAGPYGAGYTDQQLGWPSGQARPAARSATDVTSEIETLLGTIPATCRN
jgi:hypothetical protein